MNNNVNVNLSFTANTQQAQAQLQSLQTSLNNIVNSTRLGTGQLGITKQIQEGITAAAELQVHLNKALNTNTGNLDFSKLSQSLKQSGTTLQQYGAKLQQLGPTGQQAFQQLAQSVAQSEIPLRRTSTLLTNLGTTLKNTIKWQLSSSLIHGFMGSIQKAYGYAKDLNESLNNIRIVTGQNTEQMAKFAKEANKAAKALSTTTTAYTDASLIFYQQGLNDQEVLKRTDVVVKMANVTKQSVEETSDQLTAIWNNFDDGTKSLEYYADVLTKLGAATASSTDEIVGGLEKFAAISETIGLSYEYAAAALATITAKTRQSEDVVGTALKTIFGRLEGLKLGENLDDGTDLNKYSQALETVGVSIFDSNKELRDMDSILDDLGSKWQTLSRDQQVALAQTVGGMRQYNQLISLMDNWDFMKQNLNTAYSATGELTKQHEIYEESWAAASKRVSAALEEMYSKFINDDFFIDLTNGFKGFIELINDLMDSMGGLDGVLMGIGVLITRIFSNQLANGIVNMTNSLKLLAKSGQEALAAERATFVANAAKQANPNGTAGTAVEKAREQALVHEVELSETLRQNAASMSDIELETSKIMLDRQRTLDQEIIKRQEALELAKLEQSLSKDNLAAQIADGGNQNLSMKTVEERMSENYNIMESGARVQVQAQSSLSFLQRTNIDFNTEEGQNAVKLLKTKLEELRSSGEAINVTLSSSLDSFIQDLEKGEINVDELKTKLQEFSREGATAFQTGVNNNRELVDTIEDPDDRRSARTEAHNLATGIRNNVREEEELKEISDKVEKSFEKTNKQIAESSKNLKHWSQGIVGVANSAMSLGMAFSSLQGAWNTIKNPDMSSWEKFLSLSTSLGMAIPMFISGLSGLKTTYLGLGPVMTAHLLLQEKAIKNAKEETLVTIVNNAIKDLEENAEKKVALAKAFGISVEEADQLLQEKGVLLDGVRLKEKLSLILAQKLENLETSKGIVAKTLHATTTGIQIVAQKLFNATLSDSIALMMAGLAIIGVLVLAIWGMVSAFKALSKNSPEGKLKTAKETSKGLSEQLEKTKQAAEDLKSSFDKYDEVQKKLSECKKGTQEWNEALRENNDTVLELLDKYPQLKDKAGAITIGADGQLIISEEAMAEVINLQAEKVAVNTAADNTGKQNVRSLEIENKEKEFNQYVNTPNTSTADVRIFNMAKERYGTGNLNKEQLEQIAKELYENTEYEFLLKTGPEAALKLVKQYNEINQLKEENRVKTQLENVETGQQIASGLEGQEDFKYRGVIANIIGNRTTDPNQTYSTEQFNDFIKYNREGTELTEQEMIEAYREALADKTFLPNQGSTRAQMAFEEFMKQKYGENVKYDVVDFEGDQVRFTIEGEEGEQKLSYDTIAQTMFSNQQLDMNSETNKQIADYVSSLSNQLEADVFNVTQGGLFSEELLTKNKEDIDKIIDSLEMTEGQMKAFGITDLKVWKNQQKEIVKAKKAFANFKKDGVKALEDIHATMGDTKFDGLNLSDKQKDELKKQTDEISRQLSESLGADSDLGLDPDFINENYKIIQDFLNNVDGSGEELRKKLQENAKEQINTNGLDQEIISAIDNIHNYLITNLDNKDFEIGVAINSGDFFKQCQSLVETAKMTQKDAEKYFGAFGFDVKGHTKKEKIPGNKITYRWMEYRDPNDPNAGLKPQEKTVTTQEGEREVFALETLTPNASFGGNADIINNSGSVTSTGTGTGGGTKGSGEGSSKKKTKKSDIVERYKPITAQLEKQGELLNEINDLQDKLYGTDRLDNIDRYINSLEKENELLAEKERLNKQYTKEDYNALQAFAKKEGLTLKFDADGNLENETAIQEAYWNKIKSIEDSGGDSEKIKEKVDEFKSLAEAYAESLEIASEILQEQIDNFYEKIEKVQEKHDIQLELFEKDAEKAEKKVDKSYGTDRIKAEQALRAEYQKSTDYINNQALPQAFDARKGVIDQLKKYYGIEVDTNTMTAINEDDVIARWTGIKNDTSRSEEERAQAREVLSMIDALLGGLGMWNQKVDDLYGVKEENYEKTAESKWNEFDYVVEMKGVITDLEIQKIELKELFLNEDGDWDQKLQYQIQKASEVGMQQINDASDALTELLNMPEAQKKADWFERIQEASTNLADAVTQAYEEARAAFELIVEGIDNIHERAMDSIDEFGQVTDLLDHYKNLIDALGRETDYESIGAIYEADLRNSKKKLNSLTQYRDTVLLPRQRELMRDIANGVYTGEALEKAEEELELINDKLLETGQEINGTIEDIANKANEILENSIQQAVATFEEAITGGSSLEELMNDIDRLTKKQEEYLTKTNQLYETNKLIRQAQLDMDKTDNLMAKQRYQAHIKEVEQLAAAGKMSQQDLKIAQARYELLQAQIALEEAQKAKDSMRLVRGADGNWDYVYTADQSKIEDAEGKVADAENSLYNLGLEGAQEYRDKILELDQEYAESVKEINEKYKNDEQKRQEELSKLLQHHLEVRAGYEREYYKAYDLLVANSSTGYADYMLGNITSTEEFETAALEMFNNFNKATQVWQENMQIATDVVSGGLEDVYDWQDEISDQTNNELIPTLENEMEALGKEADAWKNVYNEIIKAYKAKAAYAETGMNATQEAAGKNADNIDNAHNNENNIDWSSEMLKAAINNDHDALKNAMKKRAEKEKETGKNYGYASVQLYNILTNLKRVGFDLNYLIDKPISTWATIAKEKGITFASGGYTGTWGSEGKFAMLHQKELVLNAQDTENMLAAVGLVRELSKQLDLKTAAYKYSLSQLRGASNIKLERDTLKQDVTIHAEFPNVSSRDEIEAAFNNLVNDAVQYVNME